MTPQKNIHGRESCIHAETKCTECGKIFDTKTTTNEIVVDTTTSPIGKWSPNSSIDSATISSSRRRFSSSATYYGTYMKSIDESSCFGDDEDDGEDGNEEDIKGSDSGEIKNKEEGIKGKKQEQENRSVFPPQSPPPNKPPYLVKYSVNGVLKGQTRLSYSFEDALLMDEMVNANTSDGVNDGSADVDLINSKMDNLDDNAFTECSNISSNDIGKIRNGNTDTPERNSRSEKDTLTQNDSKIDKKISKDSKDNRNINNISAKKEKFTPPTKNKPSSLHKKDMAKEQQYDAGTNIIKSKQLKQQSPSPLNISRTSKFNKDQSQKNDKKAQQPKTSPPPATEQKPSSDKNDSPILPGMSHRRKSKVKDKLKMFSTENAENAVISSFYFYT